MQSHQFIKYAFRIQTRFGVVVDNLMIHGRDEHDAQRKLRQVYHGCRIVDCVCHRGGVRVPVASFDDTADLAVR